MVVTYSLVRPREELLNQIGVRNLEGGKILIKDILKSYGIHDADIDVYSATEIRVKTKSPLPKEVIDYLNGICECFLCPASSRYA